MFVTKKKLKELQENFEKEMRELKDSHQSKLKELEESREMYKEQADEFKAHINQKLEQLDLLKEPIQEMVKREEQRTSSKPWVEFLGDEENDHGVGTKLDWNDAFIDELKAAGYNGESEYDMVMSWFARIASEAYNAEHNSI